MRMTKAVKVFAAAMLTAAGIGVGYATVGAGSPASPQAAAQDVPKQAVLKHAAAPAGGQVVPPRAAPPQAVPPQAIPPAGGAVGPIGPAARVRVQKPDAKQVLEKLKGEWAVTSLEFGGEAVPEEGAKRMGFTFSADKVTIAGKLAQGGGQFVVSDGASEYPFAIGATKQVAEIDIRMEEKEPAKGVFKLDGDDLVLCVDFSRAERPAGFETKGHAAYALYRLKRKK